MNKLLFVILYRLHIKLQPYYHKKYQSSLTPCYPNTVIFSHTYIEGAALIKSIIYKDNEWNHIKHISKFMWNDFIAIVSSNTPIRKTLLIIYAQKIKYKGKGKQSYVKAIIKSTIGSF